MPKRGLSYQFSMVRLFDPIAPSAGQLFGLFPPRFASIVLLRLVFPVSEFPPCSPEPRNNRIA